MLPDYADIRALAPDREPDWWDNDGVPRYAPFHPDMLGVYDRWAILAEIGCQGCDRRLLVGCGWSIYDRYRYARAGDPPVEPPTLARLAETFGYGDPPIHRCIGDTMSTYPTRIVQAWSRTSGSDWARDPVCEGAVDMPDWAR
jgi:hypothetical protein